MIYPRLCVSSGGVSLTNDGLTVSYLRMDCTARGHLQIEGSDSTVDEIYQQLKRATHQMLVHSHW